MNLFLIGTLLFFGGFWGLALTVFLAYYFPANMVRSAMAAGAVSVGSLATQIPEKRKVFSYLIKQLFYWKSWSARYTNARLVASRVTTSVKEIGFWRTTWKGIRSLSGAGWSALKSFIKALLLPYAIAAGLFASVMMVGGVCVLIAFGMWVFS